jgi:hypothetical protein
MQNCPKLRTTDLLTEIVDDGRVVYDQMSNVAHSLSSEASIVWEYCDGTRTAAEISDVAQLDRAIVDRALVEFDNASLLESVSSPRGMSRRDLGIKFGKAALLAPLVYSLAIPAAMAASSTATCMLTGGNPPSGGSVASGGRGYSEACAPGGTAEYNLNCYLPHGSTAPICTPAGGFCDTYNMQCQPNGSATGTCCAGTCAGIVNGNGKCSA